MTTIIVDEKTIAGKTLLDVATLLAKNESDILINRNSDGVVAFDVDGNALNKQQYIHRVIVADARITAGEYILVEDLETEVNSWI